MTVTKIFKSKYFLVTMCIFIVFAAWGTLVFHVEDNSDGTHFFAVNLLSFFVEIPPDSLNKKRPPEFVPWFDYSSAVYENSFNYFLNTMCIKNGVILIKNHSVLSSSFRMASLLSICMPQQTIRGRTDRLLHKPMQRRPYLP